MCYPQLSSHLLPFSFSFWPLATGVTAVAGQLCFKAENCAELCQNLLKQVKHSGFECMVWKCNRFPERCSWGKSRAAKSEIVSQYECWVVEKR